MAARHSTEPLRRAYPYHFLRALLFVLFLLFATWNRSGYCYWAWVRSAAGLDALQAVAGIALLIGYVAATRIAYVAIGFAGTAAVLLLLAVLVLGAAQLGLVTTWVLLARPEFWLVVAASVLAVGIGWARYQERLGGERGSLKTPP